MANLIGHARAAGYILTQRLVGAVRARDECLAALGARPGDRILDVGCGPAYYLAALPECEYFGFDTNSAQIQAARARFGDRAKFFDEPFTAEHQRALGPFDKVLLLGILHHLDDASSRSLLDLVAGCLKPGGVVVALDTPLYEGQSSFSRFLAKNDRGDFVRYAEAYVQLASQSFEQVESRLLGDTLSMPWSFIMMVMKTPRAQAAA
ncbi:MAG TPA: class I SAM-dependent methyltransferase [Polyangiaceae bacterium]